MRGFGAVQACFAYEAQMDKLAAKLDMDPVEFRQLNAMEQGTLLPTGQPCDSPAPVAELLRRVTLFRTRTARSHRVPHRSRFLTAAPPRTARLTDHPCLRHIRSASTRPSRPSPGRAAVADIPNPAFRNLRRVPLLNLGSQAS
ncbi:hypothetical protein SCALM49S_02156 [Streptomyces californicus]